MQDDFFKSILVIDDDLSNSEVIQKFLVKKGYICRIASDADQALTRLGQEQFDLVISDIVMGEKDGIALMKEAREPYPHLEFIIMTGHDDMYSYRDIIAAGAVDYLTKPFSLKDLQARLERIRWQKWTERELEKYQDRLEELVKERTAQLELEINERLRAEDALKAAERRYRNIFENSLLGIYQSTLAGNYIVSNNAFANILGYESPDDLRNSVTNIEEQVYANPHDRQKFIQSFNKTDTLTTEIEVKRKDGSTAWVFHHVRVVRDNEGNILYYEGMAEDITEHKQAEEKIREHVLFLETLFDTIPNPIFHKDIKGHYTGCNRAFLEFTGRTMEEVLGRTVYDITSKDIADKYAEKDRELFERPGKQHYEWQVKDARGECRKFIFDKAALVDAHGAVTGLIGVFSDITEHKRTEEALRESQQQLEDIINLLPDATLVVDKEGRVIAWSRAMEEMTGVRKGDIVGKSNYAPAVPFYGQARPMMIDLLLSGDAELVKSYGHIERKGSTFFAEEYVPGIHGGTGGYVWATASPLFDRQGNLIGAIESIRDITERKKMESALLQREKELEAKSLDLEEINTALKVLLKRREEDQKEFGVNVLSNLKELVFPYVEKLRISGLNEIQSTYLGILDSHLREISSPFLRKLSSEFTNLSPMELQIATLIKEGKQNKEMAEMLGVSVNTILTHRYHLRTKLGVKNKDINLRSYLKSIDT